MPLTTVTSILHKLKNHVNKFKVEKAHTVSDCDRPVVFSLEYRNILDGSEPPPKVVLFCMNQIG